jgi:hypothetical protein
MILYHFRHRGPMEYEKFVLDILQLYNEVTEVLANDIDNDSENTLSDIHRQINDIYINNVGKSDTSPLQDSIAEDNREVIGLSEKLYYKLLYYRGC